MRSTRDANPPPPILTLPVELFTHIGELLDITSLCSVRLTCRAAEMKFWDSFRSRFATLSLRLNRQHVDRLRDMSQCNKISPAIKELEFYVPRSSPADFATEQRSLRSCIDTIGGNNPWGSLRQMFHPRMSDRELDALEEDARRALVRVFSLRRDQVEQYLLQNSDEYKARLKLSLRGLSNLTSINLHDGMRCPKLAHDSVESSEANLRFGWARQLLMGAIGSLHIDMYITYGGEGPELSSRPKC